MEHPVHAGTMGSKEFASNGGEALRRWCDWPVRLLRYPLICTRTGRRAPFATTYSTTSTNWRSRSASWPSLVLAIALPTGAWSGLPAESRERLHQVLEIIETTCM